jgi:hypothetical protein
MLSARLNDTSRPCRVGHSLPLRSVFVLFRWSFLTDTFRMPQTWIFERASERIVVSRHSFVNCTHLIVVAHDGTTRSRSFDTTDDAILYQALFERALTAAGWVLEEVVAPIDEHMAVDLGNVASISHL